MPTPESLNREKARRAAKSSARPGQLCKASPGAYRPQVDHHRCEGKNDCVEVCPYGVFEVRMMEATDFSALSFLGKFKSWVHGKQTAYTPRADACQACGLCVVACPEKAIELKPK